MFLRIFIISLISIIIVQICQDNESFATQEPPKNPNSAKGCAICHYRWIDIFFVDGRGSDLVDYQPEKVVATPEMCMSCHDGSVIDSRGRIQHGQQHKTNISPPSNMKIPGIFPLDENGHIQCSTCHTAHGVPSGTGSDETIFLRTSNKASAMCRMCHPDKDGGKIAGNHPIGSSKQAVPRSLVNRGAIVGGKKNEMICETCHTAHGSRAEGYLVQGAGDCGLCVECHADKKISTAKGERKPFHIINERPRKLKISQELIAKGSKLGYGGVIICQTCHKVHNNKIEQQLLLIKNDKKSGLCITCHADKISLADTEHNLSRSAPNERNLQGQTVSEAGMCSACHLPHKTARNFYIKENGSVPAMQFCLDCHNENGMAKKKLVKDHSHPVNISPIEKGVKTTLPLYDQNGSISEKGVMACPTCHDPHHQDQVRKSTDNLVHNEQKLENNFLRMEYFPSPMLCENCHKDKGYIKKTDHDLTVTAPSSKNIVFKTPSESGTCGVCHMVHNSKNDILLWAQELGAGTNIMEKMCNSCHSENGSAKNKIPQISSHPDTQIVSITSNMKTNPYFIPIWGDIKRKPVTVGNISCPSCHNVHQWDPISFNDGAGINLEGNATNSFLRPQVHSKICNQCHGLDALFRFKFFHKVDARVKQESNAQQK